MEERGLEYFCDFLLSFFCGLLLDSEGDFISDGVEGACGICDVA